MAVKDEKKYLNDTNIITTGRALPPVNAELTAQHEYVVISCLHKRRRRLSRRGEPARRFTQNGAAYYRLAPGKEHPVKKGFSRRTFEGLTDVQI